MTDSTQPAVRTSAAGRVVSATIRFLGGVVAGVAILIVIWIAWGSANGNAHWGGLTVTASGAAASAQGARTMTVRTERALARLTCRDGCDDLKVEADHGSVTAIEVRDAQGRCLACANPQGQRPWRVRDVWTVGDPSGLHVARSTAPEARGPQ